MRSELKIGIAIGLFIVVLAVIYFVVVGGESEPQQPTEEQKQQEPTAFNLPEETPPPGDETTTAPEDEEGGIIQPSIGDNETSPGDETTGPADVDVGPEDTDLPGIPEDTEMAAADTERGPEETVLEGGYEPLIVPVEPEDEEIETPGTEDITTPRSTGGDTYVVKEGDAGFWGIAEKVYGSGKHWRLIQDANPDVDPRRLQAGQVLKIPELSRTGTPTGRHSTGSVEEEGGTLSGNIYTVKKGDAGFWGISNKVYGNGKYWYLIQKANPDVDSNSLQPGQKLRIPDLEGAAVEDVTTPARPSREEPEEPDAGDNRPIFDL